MIEIRDSTLPNVWSMSGTASTWSRPYYVNDPRRGTFLETVQRNAFDGATSGRDSVELRLEHNPSGPVLASTATRSLTFRDDHGGLLLGAALSKADRAARAVVKDVQSGARRGLSVGMFVTGDRWGTAADGRTQLRTITSAELSEVSVVRSPANKATSVAVRAETRSTGLIEYRAIPLNWSVRQEPALMPTTIDDGEDDNPDLEICDLCDGSGVVGSGDRMKRCPACNGTGTVAVEVAAGDGEDLPTSAPQLDHLSANANRRDYSTKERQAMVKSGQALPPDGSWPIRDRIDLANALRAFPGRATKNPSAVNQHIIDRARAIGALSMLPKTWVGLKRSAVLARNDSSDLLSDLFHLPGEVRARVRVERARERAIVAEARRLRERAWAAHPDLVARRRAFAEYERLMTDE